LTFPKNDYIFNEISFAIKTALLFRPPIVGTEGALIIGTVVNCIVQGWRYTTEYTTKQD